MNCVVEGLEARKTVVTGIASAAAAKTGAKAAAWVLLSPAWAVAQIEQAW